MENEVSYKPTLVFGEPAPEAPQRKKTDAKRGKHPSKNKPEHRRGKRR